MAAAQGGAPRPRIVRASTIPESLNNFCRGMLRELSAWYEVVAVASPGRALDELAAREGVRTVAVPMERHIAPWKDAVSLLRMVIALRRERPRMVHSMTPKAGLVCMAAAWLTGVPVRVHTFTGLVWPTSTGIKRRILMFTDWLTCAFATHVIPEGEGVRNDLLAHHITAKPIRVLGYGSCKGIDLNAFRITDDIARQASQLHRLRGQDVFTFLFVGRITRDKGIHELVQAFVKLHDRIPRTRLVLVGRAEEKLDPVAPEVRQLMLDPGNGIEQAGELRGELLLVQYAAADCFVLPSYREGFPNTVLEAGAMGLPSVVTDINGSREIVTDGFNGLIVPPHDAGALADAMERMATDETGTTRMAAGARDIVAQRYDMQFVHSCLYDFYRSIL